MLTTASLLEPEGIDAIEARIRFYLGEAGLPTGSWAPAPVGLENLRIRAIATAVQALMARRVSAIARGRLLATADDTVDDGPWLSFHGQEVYRLARGVPTKTIKYMALFSTAGSSQPPFNFEVGDLRVRAPSTENTYINIDPGKFSGANTAPPPTHAGNALVMRFEAEEAGARFADPAGTITEMVTARAGVQCVNIRPRMFEEALKLGVSPGSVSAAFTGSAAPTFSTLLVRIDSTGNVGAGSWSWRTPTSGWTSGGPLAPVTVIPGGAVVAMTNGPAGDSFLRDDVFVLHVSSDVSLQGNDQEPREVFAQMCRNRHLQISDVPLEGALQLLARAASSEVARTLADADPDLPGLALMTIASSIGPASPDCLAAVQAFVAKRLAGYQGVAGTTTFPSPAERTIAVSAARYDVTATGTVYVPADQLAAAKTAASTAWLLYLASVPIARGSEAVVELAKLVQVIMAAGADDIDGALLNGAAADQVVPPGSIPTVPAGSSLAASMTWVPT